MGKKVLTWRVDERVVGRLDEIASAEGCTRSAVLDAAVASHLDDYDPGVPDAPREERPNLPRRQVEPPRAYVSTAENLARRDELLALAKERKAARLGRQS